MLAVTIVVVAALPGFAQAVTIDDLVALSKAGVADSVLVAVIDADRTVFSLSPQQILELKKSGVSDAVLVKMLGSAREFAPPSPPEPPPATVTAGPAPVYDPTVAPATVQEYDAALSPATIVVPYYVPVPVPVHARPGRRAFPPTATQTSGFGRFINDGWNNQSGTGGFINNGWITATPEPQTRATPAPLRTTPPARETPPPARVTPPPLR